MIRFLKIPIILEISISAVIAYAFYTYSPIDSNKLVLVAITLLYCVITLTGLMGIKFDYEKTTILIKTVSASFLLVGIALLVIVLSFWNHLPTLIIITSLLILIYLAIVIGVSKSKH
jgi:peptidoglycan/LPS O-acetylase OafA/YrhL